LQPRTASTAQDTPKIGLPCSEPPLDLSKPPESPVRPTSAVLGDALETCPPERRDRWRKKAERVGTSGRAAIELKCLECCAWDRPEAKRCAIRSCAIWPISSRIFSRASSSDAWPAPARGGQPGNLSFGGTRLAG
jgi:hypothetical protein